MRCLIKKRTFIGPVVLKILLESVPVVLIRAAASTQMQCHKGSRQHLTVWSMLLACERGSRGNAGGFGDVEVSWAFS